MGKNEKIDNSESYNFLYRANQDMYDNYYLDFFKNSYENVHGMKSIGIWIDRHYFQLEWEITENLRVLWVDQWK